MIIALLLSNVAGFFLSLIIIAPQDKCEELNVALKTRSIDNIKIG
jgi:hypothetical protein